MEVKVTVYITTFNRLDLLKRAIHSVNEQTHKNIEIIIADDGSVDGTVEYLKTLVSPQFICIFNETGMSRGACFGRNKAIELSNGLFITGLDDDDYFEPWRIESFLKFWENLNCHKNLAGLFDSAIEKRKEGNFKCFESSCVNNTQLRNENLIGNQIFTTKENLLSINGFDVCMPAWQDWETWIRLSKKLGCFINIHTDSYIIDQSHDSERISIKKSKYIRQAYLNLIVKISPVTLKEKINLTSCLYNYSQVEFRFQDLVYLVLGFRFKVLLKLLLRALK